VCKKSITNSQPFVEKMAGPLGGIFFDSHCMYVCVCMYVCMYCPWKHRGIEVIKQISLELVISSYCR